MLRIAFTAGLLALAAACAQLPRAEFQAYRELVKVAQSAAEPMIADYAVAERAELLEKMRTDGQRAYDDYFPGFRTSDSDALSTLSLPPGAGAVNRAFRGIAAYNDTLAALAENRNVDEARGQLGQIISDIGGIVPGSQAGKRWPAASAISSSPCSRRRSPPTTAPSSGGSCSKGNPRWWRRFRCCARMLRPNMRPRRGCSRRGPVRILLRRTAPRSSPGSTPGIAPSPTMSRCSMSWSSGSTIFGRRSRIAFGTAAGARRGRRCSIARLCRRASTFPGAIARNALRRTNVDQDKAREELQAQRLVLVKARRAAKDKLTKDAATEAIARIDREISDINIAVAGALGAKVHALVADLDEIATAIPSTPYPRWADSLSCGRRPWTAPTSATADRQAHLSTISPLSTGGRPAEFRWRESVRASRLAFRDEERRSARNKVPETATTAEAGGVLRDAGH